MQKQKRKIACPNCRNKRLFDVAVDGPPESGEIDIKCPVCKNIIRIIFNKNKIRTEQIDA